MRYVFLVLLMTGVMTGLILWATKPEVLQAQYERVAQPIEDHFAEKREAIWKAAKEQAWQQWIMRAHLPGDCTHPASSLRALECKNQLDMQAQAFESDWSGKITAGWKPEGVN